MTVTLENHHAQNLLRFEHAIADVPEIVECCAVSGSIDYVLKFIVMTMDDYQRIIERLLNQNLGIHCYWTHVVTKYNKPYDGAPLARLVGKDDGQ